MPHTATLDTITRSRVLVDEAQGYWVDLIVAKKVIAGECNKFAMFRSPDTSQPTANRFTRLSFDSVLLNDPDGSVLKARTREVEISRSSSSCGVGSPRWAAPSRSSMNQEAFS